MEAVSSNFLLILAVFIIFVIIVIIVYLTETHTSDLAQHQKQLLEFSMPGLTFDEYPSKIDVSNTIDCNAHHLHVCDINDARTLFGCRELAVRCHHFDKDTEYHENNTTTIIPANNKPNEGYALQITSLVESCNPYHGDLILVALNLDTHEYMLLCNCKNPGYIGNDTLLGNCTSVRICEGEIDNIDQELDKIKCKCSSNEISIHYPDGLPVCKPMLIKDANDTYEDWTHFVIWPHDRLQNIDVFTPTIRDNLHVSKLLDPCRNSLLNMLEEIPNATYNSVYSTCKVTDTGIPVRTGILKQSQFVDTSDDNIEIRTVDGVLPSGAYKKLRILDRIAGKRRLVNLNTTLPFYNNIDAFVTLPEQIGVGAQSQVAITTAQEIYNGKCYGVWPYYYCQTSRYYDHTENGLPHAGFEEPPIVFIGGTDWWYKCERIVSSGVKLLNSGVSLDPTHYMSADQWSGMGAQFCNAIYSASVECHNGVLSFNNQKDYNKHKLAIT